MVSSRLHVTVGHTENFRSGVSVNQKRFKKKRNKHGATE